MTITSVTLHGKQESEKAHFNPVGLVRSLRDWEGQPLDVMVQQDASEFITQFFQQVWYRRLFSSVLCHECAKAMSSLFVARRRTINDTAALRCLRHSCAGKTESIPLDCIWWMEKFMLPRYTQTIICS